MRTTDPERARNHVRTAHTRNVYAAERKREPHPLGNSPQLKRCPPNRLSGHALGVGSHERN